MMDSSNLKRLMRIHEPKLKFLSRCIDQIVLWARETLDSTAHEIRRWLRSPRLKEADQRPFKVPQEQTTVKRYVGHWKQFTFFVFRTGLLDDDTREELYGIQFTSEQRDLIAGISLMLMDYDDDDTEDDDDLDYSSDEDDELMDFDDDNEDEAMDFDDDDEYEGDLDMVRPMRQLSNVSPKKVTQDNLYEIIASSFECLRSCFSFSSALLFNDSVMVKMCIPLSFTSAPCWELILSVSVSENHITTPHSSQALFGCADC